MDRVKQYASDVLTFLKEHPKFTLGLVAFVVGGVVFLVVFK